tara:strand:- start:1962 stop:2207 length:246 start_codon:yes stop_codon:yes gene_type:complete
LLVGDRLKTEGGVVFDPTDKVTTAAQGKVGKRQAQLLMTPYLFKPTLAEDNSVKASVGPFSRQHLESLLVTLPERRTRIHQ